MENWEAPIVGILMEYTVLDVAQHLSHRSILLGLLGPWSVRNWIKQHVEIHQIWLVRRAPWCSASAFSKKHIAQGLVNVLIEYLPTIGDLISNRYLEVMFKIPKKGHLPTPVAGNSLWFFNPNKCCFFQMSETLLPPPLPKNKHHNSSNPSVFSFHPLEFPVNAPSKWQTAGRDGCATMRLSSAATAVRAGRAGESLGNQHRSANHDWYTRKRYVDGISISMDVHWG